MSLPNITRLSEIIPHKAYFDKKSKEPSTGIIKPKYKLAGNALLDQYFFNLLTTRKAACKATLTLFIESGDWLEKTKGSGLNKSSYCDLTKYELLTREELIGKIRDKQNGFPFQAKLCEKKCLELQNLKQKINKDYRISEEVKKIILKGISLSIDETLSKLGLD